MSSNGSNPEPSNGHVGDDENTSEIQGESPITNGKRFPYVAAVAVDIGGSFCKLAYWRPPSPPNLPEYIIKEFEDGEPKLPLRPDPSLKVHLSSNGLEGNLRFLKFPSNRTAEFINFLTETSLHQQYGPGKTGIVMATGGGSYKYASLVKEKLGVTFLQKDEMKCLIRGLNFMLLHVEDEAFTYGWKDQQQNFISRAKQQENDRSIPFLIY